MLSHALEFSPNGDTLLSARTPSRNIDVWKTADATRIRSIYTVHDVLCLGFSSANNLFASGGYNGSVRLWNVDGTVVHNVTDAEDPSGILALAFSPCAPLLATGSSNGFLKLWKSDDDGRLQWHATVKQSSIFSLVFSPDGTNIACGGVKNIKLWNVENFCEAGSRAKHVQNGWIISVAFNPLNSIIAAVVNDGSVKLWDVADDTVHSLPLHNGLCVAFNPEDGSLACGRRQRPIHVWSNLSSGNEVWTRHERGVFAVAFSPDGATIVSGGASNCPEFYFMDNENAVETLREFLLYHPDPGALISNRIPQLSDAVKRTQQREALEPIERTIGNLRNEFECTTGGSNPFWIPTLDWSSSRTCFLLIEIFLIALATTVLFRGHSCPVTLDPRSACDFEGAEKTVSIVALVLQVKFLLLTLDPFASFFDARKALACRDARLQELRAALTETSRQFTDMNNMEVPRHQVAKCVITSFFVHAEHCIKKELTAAFEVLRNYDDQRTQDYISDSHRPLGDVRRSHVALLDPTSSLFAKLAEDAPHNAIKENDLATQASIQCALSEISELTTKLNEFQEETEAFRAQAITFAKTTKCASAKIDELEAKVKAIHDLHLDREKMNVDLKRRGLSLKTRAKMEKGRTKLTEKLSQMRRQYRLKYKIARNAVFRFFPELRRKFVDANDVITTVPQYDPTMSTHALDDITRHDQSTDFAVFNRKRVIVKHFTSNEVSAFTRECKVYATVQNPFVGEMMMAFSVDNGMATVMPHYQGGTADTWADRHRDDAFLTIRLLRQVADGLECLHRANITHCDFKPQNVVMTSGDSHGVAKIIDFGCADVQKAATVLFDRSTQTVKSGLSGFTRKYVAPEVEEAVVSSNNIPADLVCPALDIYAFGVWMSEVLPSEKSEDGRFQLAKPVVGTLVSPLLDACQPFKGDLEELMNMCCSLSPDNRPSARSVSAKLAMFESMLEKDRSAKCVEDHEILECSVCYSEVKRKDAAICKVPLGNNIHQEAHVYCCECLKVMLEDWHSMPIATHVDAKGKVKCMYGACTGLLDEQTILAMLPGAFEVMTRVQQSIAELVALENYKHQLDNESHEKRAIRHIDENILAVRCPNCKTAAVIDFTACLALTCPRCGSNFCGYCMVDCGFDAHAHVITAHPHLGMFTNEEQWYHHFYNQRLPMLNEYLRTLPDEVAANLRRRFPAPVNP